MFYLSTRQAEQLWCTCSFGSGFGFRKAGNWHPWNPWNPWSWSRHLCLQGQSQFSFGRLDQASATDLCKRWRPKFRHPSQLHGQDRLCFLINKWYLRFLYVWSFFSFPKTPRFFGFLPGNACRFQVVFCDSFVHCDQIAVLYQYIIVYHIVLRSCAEILSHPSKQHWAAVFWVCFVLVLWRQLELVRKTFFSYIVQNWLGPETKTGPLTRARPTRIPLSTLGGRGSEVDLIWFDDLGSQRCGMYWNVTSCFVLKFVELTSPRRGSKIWIAWNVLFERWGWTAPSSLKAVTKVQKMSNCSDLVRRWIQIYGVEEVCPRRTARDWYRPWAETDILMEDWTCGIVDSHCEMKKVSSSNSLYVLMAQLTWVPHNAFSRLFFPYEASCLCFVAGVAAGCNHINLYMDFSWSFVITALPHATAHPAETRDFTNSIFSKPLFSEASTNQCCHTCRGYCCNLAIRSPWGLAMGLECCENPWLRVWGGPGIPGSPCFPCQNTTRAVFSTWAKNAPGHQRKYNADSFGRLSESQHGCSLEALIWLYFHQHLAEQWEVEWMLS